MRKLNLYVLMRPVICSASTNSICSKCSRNYLCIVRYALRAFMKASKSWCRCMKCVNGEVCIKLVVNLRNSDFCAPLACLAVKGKSIGCHWLRGSPLGVMVVCNITASHLSTCVQSDPNWLSEEDLKPFACISSSKELQRGLLLLFVVYFAPSVINCCTVGRGFCWFL